MDTTKVDTSDPRPNGADVRGSRGGAKDAAESRASGVAAASATPDPQRTYRVRHGSLFLSPDRVIPKGAPVSLSPDFGARLVALGLLDET